MIQPLVKLLVVTALITGLSACNVKDDFPVSSVEVEKMKYDQLSEYQKYVHIYKRNHADDLDKQQRAQEMLDRISAARDKINTDQLNAFQKHLNELTPPKAAGTK